MPTLKEYGNIRWWTLHAESVSFRDEPTMEERAAFSIYLESFAKVFPCPEYLKRNPVYPHTESQKKLFLYLYDFHEDVNIRKLGGSRSNLDPTDVWNAFQPGVPWENFGEYMVFGEKDLDETGKIIRPKPIEAGRIESSSSTQAKGFEAWFQSAFNTTMSSTDLLLWIAIIILIFIVFALSIGWIAYAIIENNKHSKEKQELEKEKELKPVQPIVPQPLNVI